MPFFYYCFVKSGTSFKPLRLSFVDITLATRYFSEIGTRVVG